MRWGLVLLLLSSFACVRYKKVSIGPEHADGVGCLQTCKQTHRGGDAIVECAATCPGALVQTDAGECPTAVDGEPEAAPGCVSTVHVRWGRIAKIAGVIAGSALVITALLFVAMRSTTTH